MTIGKILIGIVYMGVGMMAIRYGRDMMKTFMDVLNPKKISIREMFQDE